MEGKVPRSCAWRGIHLAAQLHRIGVKKPYRIRTKVDDAEKASVGRALAGVIGADKEHDGYLEGNGYLVSWCIGHLVRLAEPDAYDKKYRKWQTGDLPIFPENFQWETEPDKSRQFRLLKSLMDREDVEKPKINLRYR